MLSICKTRVGFSFNLSLMNTFIDSNLSLNEGRLRWPKCKLLGYSNRSEPTISNASLSFYHHFWIYLLLKLKLLSQFSDSTQFEKLKKKTFKIRIHFLWRCSLHWLQWILQLILQWLNNNGILPPGKCRGGGGSFIEP